MIWADRVKNKIHMGYTECFFPVQTRTLFARIVELPRGAPGPSFILKGEYLWDV